MNMYLYFLSLFVLVNCDFGPKNINNYGPYVVEWHKFDKCKGPKLKNITTYENRLFTNEENQYIGQLNFTFLEEASIDEIKMYVYTLKETGKVLQWNYNINKPCQHYMFAVLLETHLGTKNCFAKKQMYYTDMNLSVLMAKYIGKQFFYGEYLFKVVLNSKKGNIMCMYFDPKFKKKIDKD